MKAFRYELIPVPKKERSQYKTIGGVVEMEYKIEVPKVILPTLLQTQHFSARMQVESKELGDPRYGVIIGRELMKELDINLSLRDDTITWGELTCNMVLKVYWTKERINASLSKLTRGEKEEIQFKDELEKDRIQNENEVAGIMGK
mmetsp:Transcript_34254/g.72079  ORF Transcript_34254/g.72079 Transcript_34254/m.72079 type:complete len:146 (-) Transcript_34254:919-1356(-)